MNDDTTKQDEAVEIHEAIAGEPAGAAPAAEDTKLQNEIDDLRNKVLYAQADTQNVRRRLEKEVADARAYAATGFARDMLSIADNLSRALSSIAPELRDNEAWKPLITGLEATGRELDAVFQRHGIAKIVAVGEKLDPNKHQAMIELPSDQEPGTIVQEMQAGYTIKDRLLRPAMVGVAKSADPAA